MKERERERETERERREEGKETVHVAVAQDVFGRPIDTAQETAACMWAADRSLIPSLPRSLPLSHRVNEAILSDRSDDLILFCPFIRFLDMYIASHPTHRKVRLYRGCAASAGAEQVIQVMVRQPMFVSVTESLEMAMRNVDPGADAI